MRTECRVHVPVTFLRCKPQVSRTFLCGFAPPMRTMLTLLQVELHPGLAEFNKLTSTVEYLSRVAVVSRRYRCVLIRLTSVKASQRLDRSFTRVFLFYILRFNHELLDILVILSHKL